MSDEIMYLIEKFNERYEFNYKKYSTYFEEFYYEIQNAFVYFLSEGKIKDSDIQKIASEIYKLNKLQFPRKIYD
jgi:hypothetical protein